MKLGAMACWLLVALFAPAAVAADTQDRLQQIMQQQHQLQEELDRIEGLSARQRNVIRKMQGRLFAAVDGKSTLDQLTIEQKVTLENALERINAELVNTREARDEQDKCHMQAGAGSRFESARCASINERAQDTQEARFWKDRPRVCSGPGCG